jgi:hypothetical protein
MAGRAQKSTALLAICAVKEIRFKTNADGTSTRLTTGDLDKLDAINVAVIDEIKAAKLPAELEIHLRTEFANFLGKTIEAYNATNPNPNPLTTNLSTY